MNRLFTAKYNLLSSIIFFLAVFLYLQPNQTEAAKNLDFTKGTHTTRSGVWPLHWARWGWYPGNYEIGLSKKIHRKGGVSAYIRLKKGRSSRGFAQFLQFVSASAYQGKRVRLSGFIKANATQAVWFKLVLGSSMGRKTLEYARVAPKGKPDKKGWYKIEIVQDIPKEATRITIGCGLKGKGPLYCDDFKLEVVSNKTALTPNSNKRKRKKLSSSPQNLDFTKGTHKTRYGLWPLHWERWGWRPIDYQVGLSRKVHRKGGVSAYIRLKKGLSSRGFAQLLQFISAKQYRGKRLRLTGYIKTNPKNSKWFKLILGSAAGRRTLKYSRVPANSPADSKGWYKIQITQDIPKSATRLTIGCGLKGTGPIYCDAFKIEVIK